MNQHLTCHNTKNPSFKHGIEIESSLRNWDLETILKNQETWMDKVVNHRLGLQVRRQQSSSLFTHAIEGNYCGLTCDEQDCDRFCVTIGVPSISL